MLTSNKLIAFITTAQPKKAQAFYEDILGLTLKKDEEFTLVFDANGTQLRIQKLAAVVPAYHTAIGWEVDDVKKFAERLKKFKVAPEKNPYLDQDEDGVTLLPNKTKALYFRDPDWNLIQLIQAEG